MNSSKFSGIDLNNHWHPLNLFVKGLKNSSKNTGDLKPAGLVSCLNMARYCLMVSPGFLPRNPSDSIFLSKSEDCFYQINIPLDFSQITPEEADPYRRYKWLIARVKYNDSSNLKFSLLEREIEPTYPRIFLSEISLESNSVQEVIEDVRTLMKKKNCN